MHFWIFFFHRVHWLLHYVFFLAHVLGRIGLLLFHLFKVMACILTHHHVLLRSFARIVKIDVEFLEELVDVRIFSEDFKKSVRSIFEVWLLSLDLCQPTFHFANFPLSHAASTSFKVKFNADSVPTIL